MSYILVSRVASLDIEEKSVTCTNIIIIIIRSDNDDDANCRHNWTTLLRQQSSTVT